MIGPWCGWTDSGKTDPVNAPGRSYEVPRISPDGDQVAFVTSGAKFDVWVHNLARGDATKLTSEGSNQFPIWTPDGKRLTYRATRAGTETSSGGMRTAVEPKSA